jgi:hypothetical protein
MTTKTELRPVPHSTLPGETAVELWHDGKLIGAVYGADGPGVRVVSKHLSVAMQTSAPGVTVTEVLIDPTKLIPKP